MKTSSQNSCLSEKTALLTGFFLSFFLYIASGCGFPIPDLDVEAPTVRDSIPVGTATTTPNITIRFSKPILHETLNVTNAFVLVKTEEITSTFLSDLNNPPLIISRQALVIDGNMNLHNDAYGTILNFVPSRPLEGDTAYSYLVSRSVTDENNNPLVVPLLDEEGNELVYQDSHPDKPGEVVLVAGNFRADFVTGRAIEVEGPQVIERFPENGAINVPPNLDSVRVRFNEAANGVNSATFQIVSADGTAVASRGVDVFDGRTLAVLSLQDNLALSSEYRIVLRDAITDERGNRLDESLNESTFTTASCMDNSPPVINEDTIEVMPVDTYANISWRSNEPSTSTVYFGISSPDTSVEGPPGRCALASYDPCAEPPQDAACTHNVTVEGLNPETGYVFMVRSVDAAGNQAESSIKSFNTIAPLPPVIVNEVQATPDVTPQEAAEFIEIYNAGSSAIDLAGWIIAESSQEPERTQELQEFPPYDSILDPGEYALLVGQLFDAANYPNLGTNVIVSGSGNRLLTYGLADTRGLVIELRSPQDALVSRFGGWYRGDSNRGVSIERIDPAGPDILENWTWSVDPSGATPGFKNSVTD